jgi:hypothetical protein
MSDLAEYAKEIRAIFADETNPTQSRGTMSSPGTPGIPTTPGIPAVTAKPVVPNPPQTAAPIATPSVPTSAQMDPNGKLEENAKKKLAESLNNLPSATKNLEPGFNDDFFKRLGSSAVPYTGLDQDFVRKTGVNDASHKDTLRYSRLVDALNNRRYIGPAKGGTFDIIHGQGAVQSGNTAIGPGDIYKMDGLETAESRAQRRAEGYEATERGREINRREDVKDMPAALERFKQLAVLEQARALTQEEMAERRQLFTAMLNNQYNIPYQLMQARYSTELGMTQQQYNTMLAMQMAQYAAQNGLTTQQFAAQLGMDAARYNTMLGMVTQQFATVLAEYIYRVTGIYIPQDKVNMMMANPDYLTRGMLGNAWGIGSPDLQAQLFSQALNGMGINIGSASIDQILAAQAQLLRQMEAAGIKQSDESQKAIGK